MASKIKSIQNKPEIPSNNSVPAVYYMDGYHGGIKGHMPLGAFRDIVNALERFPEWNINLEIEPISWDYLRHRDPEVYLRLKNYLSDPSNTPRVELVNSNYAQPYNWVIGGESNIRQFTRGLEIARAHFPEAKIDTYAVQEPCFTSCLPQILLSLGYVRASLVNNTVFVGNTAGFDAEMVNWIGPDGSSIPTVPRYTFDTRVNMWDLRSGFAREDYSREAVEKGIAHPVGHFFQDCGWASHPWHPSPHTKRVTAREYFVTILGKPTADYHFTQDDMLGSLPWGEKTLQALARYVRAAENKILMAEKLASMATIWSGLPWPSHKFQEAWDQLLLAQHHDGWACATARAGRMQWGWQVSAESWVAEEICDKVIAESIEALSQSGAGVLACDSHNPLSPSLVTIQQKSGKRNASSPTPSAPTANATSYLSSRPAKFIRVFNTLGTSRSELVEVPFTADPGTIGIRITNDKGEEIPNQIMPSRRYGWDNNSINAGSLLFSAAVPTMGYNTFRMETISTADTAPADLNRSAGILPAAGKAKSKKSPNKPDVFTRTLKNGLFEIHTDLYRIQLEPNWGGRIKSLYSKTLKKEFVDLTSERLFNEFRGYDTKNQRWISTADRPAQIEIQENGPLRIKLLIKGEMAGHHWSASLSAALGDPIIRMGARIFFREDTWIGDPIEIADRMNSFQSAAHGEQHKLQAHFPVALSGQKLFKNAAYDVCESRLKDTFFNNFNSMKHRVILNWVDVTDSQGKYGLALFSDHTTSYSHGKNYPLSLTLGWGGHGWWWWGNCPFKGALETQYSIMPHAGKWDAAGISLQNARLCEPLIPQITLDDPKKNEWAQSLLDITPCSSPTLRTEGPQEGSSWKIPSGWEIPTTLIDGNDLLVRLFNASGDDTPQTISFSIQTSPSGLSSVKAPAVDMVELDGRLIKGLSVKRLKSSTKAPKTARYTVQISMPRFGIRTLRFRGILEQTKRNERS